MSQTPITSQTQSLQKQDSRNFALQQQDTIAIGGKKPARTAPLRSVFRGTKGTRNGPRRRARLQLVGGTGGTLWSRVDVVEGRRFGSPVGEGCGRSGDQNGRRAVTMATERAVLKYFSEAELFHLGGHY